MPEDKEEKITLEFIARRLELIHAEQRNLRKDFRDQTALVLQVAEHSRRLSRQMTELRDDLELLIRSEFMGRFAGFETRFEETINALRDRIETIEAKER